MGSIQNGVTELLTQVGPFLALRFENAITLCLRASSQSAWMSYSEAGLQYASQRFKIQQDDVIDFMIINFSEPRSGTLYFASVDAINTGRIAMWQL